MAAWSIPHQGRRRLLAASAGLCAVGCAVMLLDAGRLPSGLVALREIPVLPSGISPRRHPAALYIQQTLKGLKSDADEKLEGHNLHRHARRKGAAGSKSRGQLARAEARKAAWANVLDPDVEEARQRKFEHFERGQTLADLQHSLSSPLFSAQGRARAVPPADQARIAKLESAKLPGPLDAIPKDMLNAEKAPTTMLTDRLSFWGVNTGYPEDRVEYVPRVGGKLHAFGVNTGEEGAWEGEDHWDDEQVPIEESFSTHYGLQPAPGHPEGFGVNKYWAPVFGARGETGTPRRETMLAQVEAEVEDNNGIPELRLDEAPRESASRSSLSIPSPSSSVAGSSRRERAQGREEDREAEEKARTMREKPSKTPQRREEERDAAEQAQAREQQKQYTPEAAAEAAAWMAAGSQGPVNAGGDVLDAKMAARSMEDGAVADSEESDAMNTLRAAMVDARQKTPGHREPLARRPRMSNR
jgi:hypothetical protein